MSDKRSRMPAALAALLSLVLFAVSANIVFASLVRASGEFGVSPEALANVSAMQFTGFFLSSVVGGLLADRFGKKAILEAGCVFLLVGAAIWASSRSVDIAFAGGFVMGLGGGILESMSSALLTDLFPEKRKFYLNMSQVAYCAGAVGGPALMGRLLPLGVSWRWFFAGTAVSAVVLLVLYGLAFVPRPQVSDRDVHASFKPGSHLFRGSLIVSCVVLFLYVFAEMGLVTFLAMYLQESLGAPENWAIYGISIFWCAMIVGRIGCAFIPERQAYELVVGVLLLCAAIAMLLQAGTESWQASILVFALTGLAFAGTWPLIVGMVAARSRSGTGATVGIVVACGSLGCIAAPPILGRLFAIGRPEWVFLLLAAVLGAAIVLVMLLAILHRRQKD